MRQYSFDIRKNQSGSVIIALIITMVVVGGITAAVVTMTSTGPTTIVPSSQGLNAYYLAELGYRYLAGQYLNTTNTFQKDDYLDTSADDEKSNLLEVINGTTYSLPNSNDRFLINISSYFFRSIRDYDNARSITVTAPGGLPPNFLLPSTGFLKLDNTNNAIQYSSASINGNRVTFDFQQTRINSLSQNEFVYIVLRPDNNQINEVSSNNDLILSSDSASFIPHKNGLIHIGTNDREIFYKTAEFDKDNNRLTLTSLFSADGNDFRITGIDTNTDVTFKKFILVNSQGETGEGIFHADQSIQYYVPIGDSRAEAFPFVITMKNRNEVNQSFSRAGIGSYEVSENNWDNSVGKVLSTTINSLSRGADMGMFIFKKQDMIENIWKNHDHTLSYELQCKFATGVELLFGGIGLSFRVKSSNGGYRLYGLSFMKYYSPSIGFYNGGTTPIRSGDVITQRYSTGYHGPVKTITATVDGDPIITGGSWKNGNAVGRLRIKNISGGDFKENTDILVNDEKRAVLEDGVYYNGFDDGIPDDITPTGEGDAIRWKSGWGCPDDDKDCIMKIGNKEQEFESLLLVLWQQKIDRYGNEDRRWLAYKNITADYCVKGKQSLDVDGRIINDAGGLSIQVNEEFREYNGSDVKVNVLNTFYSDNSKNNSYNRTPNFNRYDINKLRDNYGFLDIHDPQPTWPPKKLKYWSIDMDFFSLIEKPTYDENVNSPEQFQWDAINPEVTDMAVFEMTEQGEIIMSDFTTPDSGEYNAAEVGMHAYGNLANDSWGGRRNRMASFVDFGFRSYTPGHSYGGFYAAIQE